MSVGNEMSYADCVTLVACVYAMRDVEELDPRSEYLLFRLEEALARHGRAHEADDTTTTDGS